MVDREIKVIAVVLSYNGEKIIRDCLASLALSTIEVQTVVVDNVSTDSTLQIVEQFPSVVVLRQEKNLGSGQGYNVGMRYALEHGADYVLLFNQDVVVDPAMVEHLIDIAEHNPEFGILSPLHLNKDGTGIDERTVKYITRETSVYFDDLLFNMVKPVYDVWFLPAAAWLITEDCARTVGGFDNIFFIYGEDDDYCFRAKDKGYKFGMVPAAKMLHMHIAGTPSKQSPWKNIIKNSKYTTTLAVARLKRGSRSFLLEVLLWAIDHSAEKCKRLVKGHGTGFVSHFIAGLNVLIKLPRIYKHIQLSKHDGAFL